MPRKSIVCFVGPGNLPALAREYGHHGVGGMEVQQTLLARALARRGYDVSMVTLDFGQPDGASWDGVVTWRTYSRDAGLPGVRFIHPRWTSTWAALKRAEADIYYVSGAGMLLGLVTMFARRYGRRVVFRVASSTDCSPRTVRTALWRDRKLYEYGLRRADLVLAQTAEQQQMLLKGYGRRSLVVPSIAETAQRSLPFAERDIDVLWVGNIRALKRPHLLLEVARLMPHLRFEMAGGPYPGAENLFEQVKREAATLPNVHFHGPVPYHEMQSLYERARVLVGTSEIEGFPNIYLQAWSHGAPVVAYLDPEELIATHRLGSVVRSAEEMVRAIDALLMDDALLTDIGQWTAVSERCLQYAGRRLDESVMLAPYIEALVSLTSSRPPHTRHATTADAAR